jgi:diguanylate cyclase (GGDEF)-like protein
MQERREWADRLIPITLAVSPLSAVAFTWMFHQMVSERTLLLWALLLAATSLTSMLLAVRYRRHRRFRVGGHLVAIALHAVVFSIPPWIVGHADEPGRGFSLLFPIVAMTIGVVIFGPMRRWFAIHQFVVAAPTLVWTFSRAGGLNRWALSCIVLGVVAITTLLHREVYELTNRSIAINARNTALVGVLQDERLRLEEANQALEEANGRLRRQAAHDSLTGVLNRRGLDARLESFLGQARLAERHVHVLFCDLDRFKYVNDTFGHAAGDLLLTTTAERIARVLPDAALLARLGGDEFVTVVSVSHDDPDPTAGALELADRVRAAVATPVAFEGREFVVTTTVGVAKVPTNGALSIDVLRHADRALHYAKKAGRDRAELFSDTTEMARHPVDEAHLLRTAIEEGGIVPWYQPIVDASTGRIVGAELLARWIGADGRAVRASEFIDIAHDVGLVERLSEVLIARAIDDLRHWVGLGLPEGFRIGLNLPPRFASRTARISGLIDLLAASPCRFLTVEVSESSVIDDLNVAAARLRQLRELGIHVVLDDFGTGIASLSLLQRMPLDGVKIDRSFVTDIAHETRDRALVSSFVSLASQLGLEVTAEGVETAEQRVALLELGCRMQQGYLYGDAVDAVELLAQLRHGVRSVPLRLGPPAA